MLNIRIYQYIKEEGRSYDLCTVYVRESDLIYLGDWRQVIKEYWKQYKAGKYQYGFDSYLTNNCQYFEIDTDNDSITVGDDL